MAFSACRSRSLDAVLVAEDDPVFRHVLEYWLKKWDYRMTSVENRLDAWKILQKVDSPQMAILDWMMPVEDACDGWRRTVPPAPPARRPTLLFRATRDFQGRQAGHG
jgi:CheY-like chemotaxis protein